MNLKRRSVGLSLPFKSVFHAQSDVYNSQCLSGIDIYGEGRSNRNLKSMGHINRSKDLIPKEPFTVAISKCDFGSRFRHRDIYETDIWPPDTWHTNI